MDELPSTEFRKSYAKLTKPTVVTVMGRPIGVWQPGETAFTMAVKDLERALPSGTRAELDTSPRFGAPRPAPKR